MLVIVVWQTFESVCGWLLIDCSKTDNPILRGWEVHVHFLFPLNQFKNPIPVKGISQNNWISQQVHWSNFQKRREMKSVNKKVPRSQHVNTNNFFGSGAKTRIKAIELFSGLKLPVSCVQGNWECVCYIHQWKSINVKDWLWFRFFFFL